MTPDDYLRHLRADAGRLVAVAEGNLERAVPSCPDWDVAALVTHTATVYQHKVACMRLNRRPEQDEYAQEPPGGDPVGWLRSSLEELVAELQQRGPAEPSFTWFPRDQTVGFWFRRMAQETAVHRVDAELATGEVTPIDEALAVDGVDEIVRVFLADPDWADEEPVESATGRTVAARTSGRVWRMTLGRTLVDVSTEEGPADASVTGEPHDLLLWLWGGRVGDGVVEREGPADLFAEFRARLDRVTD